MELSLVVAMETAVVLMFVKEPMEIGFYRVTSVGAPRDAQQQNDTLFSDGLLSSGIGSTRP